MESNFEASSTVKHNDSDSKDETNPTSTEDDDSKIEIEIQISSSGIENVLTDHEESSNADAKNTDIEEEQKVHNIEENNPNMEEKELEIQCREENNSSIEEKELETHCSEENNSKIEEEKQEIDSSERNILNIEEKEQELRSTEESSTEGVLQVIEEKEQKIEPTEENISNIEEKEQDLHSAEENITRDDVKEKEMEMDEEKSNLAFENEKLENGDSAQPLEENETKEVEIDSSMELNDIIVEEDVQNSPKEKGVTKALKRPFEEIEDQSSSEGSDDEESLDESVSGDSDEDSNEVSKVEKVKESKSVVYPSSKKRKVEGAPIEINFNEAYHDPDFMKSLSGAFSNKTKMKFENGASILAEPFTCCVLPDFISSEEFIDKVKTELEEIEVESKLNDLYKFKQSVDLADYPSSEIQAIHNLLKQEGVKWLSKVTNIPLTDKIDMFCSCYTYTDHLLCHDDELEGRRIAYIYYLTPLNWEKKDGGLLDLFDTVDGEPTEVVHSYVPTCNNFVFFEVGPTSYHQVSEVLAYKTRTALSGWFYGPPLERTAHSAELVLFQAPSCCTVDIRDWINPIYLKPDTQLHIRGSFEESSEMELMDFLQNAKYEMVCQALNEKGVSWRERGPPNRRKYEELDDIETPPILKECQNLFCSEPFFLVLSNLTGLRFHPLCAETEVKMGEVNSSTRKWSQGSYSLLHEHSFFKFATLNAALCFNCPDWDPDCGGYTSYVAKNKIDELLRVDPKPNSLALVYITKKTSFFVKYVNSHVTERSKPYFQDIFSVYRELE